MKNLVYVALKFWDYYNVRVVCGIYMELKQGVGLSNAFIAGGVSGSLTRAILSPVDVLKIRFQLQVEPVKVGWNKQTSIWYKISVTMVNKFMLRFMWLCCVCRKLLSLNTKECGKLLRLFFRKKELQHFGMWCCNAVLATRILHRPDCLISSSYTC